MASGSVASPYNHLKPLIEQLPCLCQSLPSTIPYASKKDKIYEVITNIKEGDDMWLTINRHFDVLFVEDCQDKNTGHLHHIQHEKIGMDTICTYLKSIDIVNPHLPIDLIIGKITYLVEEVIYLM